MHRNPATWNPVCPEPNRPDAEHATLVGRWDSGGYNPAFHCFIIRVYSCALARRSLGEGGFVVTK